MGLLVTITLVAMEAEISRQLHFTFPTGLNTPWSLTTDLALCRRPELRSELEHKCQVLAITGNWVLNRLLFGTLCHLELTRNAILRVFLRSRGTASCS